MKTTPFSYGKLPLPSLGGHIRLVELYPAKTPDAPSAEYDAPLQCRLFTTSLSAPCPFLALSYCWGSDDKTHSLDITLSDRDGGSHTDMAALGITASLDEALRHLRQPTESTVLWIDQICIEQASSTEKNAQVERMGSIYGLATEVLVWLGPSADDSDLVMDVWQEVGAWARDWGMEGYFVDEHTFATYARITSYVDPADPATAEFHDICVRARGQFFGDPPGNMRVLGAMVAWYKRDWFTRVWVVQEFSLGRDAMFVCGHKRLDVDLVKYAGQIFDFTVGLSAATGMTVEQRTMIVQQLYREPTATFFSCRSRRRKLDMGTGKGDSLFQIIGKLYSTSRVPMAAKNPCDRIYGLLSLANDSSELGIVADYSEAVTADLVFAKATRAIIKHQKNLDVLALSQFPKYIPDHKELTARLPSWVPDWFQHRRSFYWTAGSNLESPIFWASGLNSSVRMIETGDEKVLGLEGIIVDEIEEIGRPWLGEDDPSYKPGNYPYEVNLAYFRDVQSLASKSAAKVSRGTTNSEGGISHQDPDPIYSTTARREEAVWRTLIGDVEMGADRSTRRATSPTGGEYRSLRHRCELFEVCDTGTALEQRRFIERADKDLVDKEYSQAESQFSLRLQEMRHKCPFVTKKGYLGMGPVAPKLEDVVTTQSGDVVAAQPGEVVATQPGDMVAVLYGASVPYILRPEGVSNRYKLIGDAYCDMIMDGQVIEANECRDEIFLV